MNPFGRHAREFAQAYRSGAWERADHGIVFPRQHAVLEGTYSLRRNSGVLTSHSNLLTAEGLDLIIDSSIATTSPPVFYLALYANNIAPSAAWTAATFSATAGEFNSITEGFKETTRQAWMCDKDPNAGVGVVSNHLITGELPAEFNIRTATQLSVYGVGLLTDNTLGGTTGTLLSACLMHSSPQLFDNHDILDLYYIVQLTPA